MWALNLAYNLSVIIPLLIKLSTCREPLKRLRECIYSDDSRRYPFCVHQHIYIYFFLCMQRNMTLAKKERIPKFPKDSYSKKKINTKNPLERERTKNCCKEQCTLLPCLPGYALVPSSVLVGYQEPQNTNIHYVAELHEPKELKVLYCRTLTLHTIRWCNCDEELMQFRAIPCQPSTQIQHLLCTLQMYIQI